MAKHGRSGRWAAIASELATGRPPGACLREYASALAGAASFAAVASAPRAGLPLFSADMDAMLREQVAALGPRWRLIAQRMGLEPRQVYWRWEKVLRSTQKRGNWDVAEDLLLLTAIAQLGLRFDLVAQVGGCARFAAVACFKRPRPMSNAHL